MVHGVIESLNAREQSMVHGVIESLNAREQSMVHGVIESLNAREQSMVQDLPILPLSHNVISDHRLGSMEGTQP